MKAKENITIEFKLAKSLLNSLNESLIEEGYEDGSDNLHRIKELNNCINVFEMYNNEKQNDIDELVAELENIEKYGVSDLELDILIQKHTKK